MYVWIAIDKKTRMVLAYHLSRYRDKSAFNVLLNKLKKFKIRNLHTDRWDAYNDIPEKYNPTKTKDKTTNVESFNADLRHFLSRFRRKTRCYCKCIDMTHRVMEIFLYFFNKKALKYLHMSNIYLTFVSKIKAEFGVKGLTVFS